MENQQVGGVFSITELRNDNLPYHKPYKESTHYNDRYFEYQSLRCQYPDFVPVVCENYESSPKNKLIGRNLNYRFYISKDMTIDYFRQYMKLLVSAVEKTLNKLDQVKFYIEDAVIKDGRNILYYFDLIGEANIQALYEKFKEKDGWIYLKFLIET